MTIQNFKVGDILHHSWGYDMTHNEFCKIVKISPSRKTVLCRMVRRSIEGDPGHPGSGATAQATTNVHGPEFRLWVRLWEDYGRYLFVGQFPYGANYGKFDDKTRGTFSIADPSRKFYENHCD
jgi:hypothetical protein